MQIKELLKNNPEDLWVAVYPKFSVAENDLPGLVLKKDRITPPSKIDANIRQKMRHYSKNFWVPSFSSCISITFHLQYPIAM